MTKNTQPVALKPNNPEAVRKAISIGQSDLKEGKSKVDAVRAMYSLIEKEPREIIYKTFIDGAGLTEKGAVTYHYNIKRELKKGKKPKADAE